MTCAQMGGMCDVAMTAATENEMMGKGMTHLEEAHPEMAATIKATPADDPMMVAWAKKFAEDWANTPEDA